MVDINSMFSYFYRVVYKFISKALDELKNKNNECTEDSSLLQRVLYENPDNPKVAVILALDLFLVGIDTVSFYIDLNHSL